MATITGGRVVFSRTVQPAPYEAKKSEVELTFTLDAGEDPDETAANVMAKARELVLQTVGLKKKER